MHEGLDAAVGMLGVFGGISLLVWTSMKAKIARIRAEREVTPASALPQDGAVLAELKALKQQMAEMHSTSHQFDLSFDEALSRMEGRVSRLETKSAATVASTPAEATLRNGQSQ